MRILSLVALFAIAIPQHSANASSHREAPGRNANARTVVEPSMVDQLLAWLLGEDAAPATPHQGEVTVRRPEFNPNQAR